MEENLSFSFAAECNGDGLDDQSQFHSPHAEDEQVPIRVNNTSSNAARSIVHGHSTGTSDTGGSRSHCDTHELVVLSEIPPAMIRVCGMYVNKKAFQRYQCKYAISKHFQYKVRTSKTKVLHVVCLDDNCK